MSKTSKLEGRWFFEMFPNPEIAHAASFRSGPLTGSCSFTVPVLGLSCRLDLELKDHEGSTALWLAVQYITVSSDQAVNPFDDAPVVNGTSFDENSYAARLIQRGSNTDAPDTVTGRQSTHVDLREGLLPLPQ